MQQRMDRKNSKASSSAQASPFKTGEETHAALANRNRFDKDFAAEDKAYRDQKHQAKMQFLEKKRLEQFDRDIKRWEFMEQQ